MVVKKQRAFEGLAEALGTGMVMSMRLGEITELDRDPVRQGQRLGTAGNAPSSVPLPAAVRRIAVRFPWVHASSRLPCTPPARPPSPHSPPGGAYTRTADASASRRVLGVRFPIRHPITGVTGRRESPSGCTSTATPMSRLSSLRMLSSLSRALSLPRHVTAVGPRLPHARHNHNVTRDPMTGEFTSLPDIEVHPLRPPSSP